VRTGASRPEERNGHQLNDARPLSTTAGSSPATARVALANQKGGVGKTTTAVNLSVVLAFRGWKVLLVDFDPQGNATSSLGVDKHDLSSTAYELLMGDLTLDEVVVSSVRPNLDLVPSTPALAGAEVDLVPQARRERAFQRALGPATGAYDLVLIDCPPSLGLLTVNALTAVDAVVVPIQCEFLALEGLGQLITTIDLVKRQLNPALDVLGVLMTMYDARTRLSAHVVEEVRVHFPQRIFETIIPRSIRLAEAPSYGQAIAEYDPESRGAQAYRAVADELIARLDMTQPNEADDLALAGGNAR
jgi:chromosome partitioning protein